MILPVNGKFHLRFETANVEEQLVPVQFDAQSCVAGNSVGYSGEGVVPRVMLEWDWAKMSKNSCDQGNPNFIFCDATQFNIEMNYKLDVLKRFLEKNRLILTCPTNPAQVIADDLSAELINSGYFEGLNSSSTGCWLPNSTTLYDERPALDFFLEEHENEIQWMPEDGIKNRQDVMNLLNFNSYLIQDGYSPDMLKDFQQFSDTQAFFNTPSFFNQSAVDSTGRKYGLNQLYKTGNISFHKRYAQDDTTLNSPGLYRVSIVADFNSDWLMFDQAGKPLVNVNVELSLVEAPAVDNPFYRLPFNGNVGMEGGTLNRQGYGISYINNSGDAISINNASQTVTTTGDSGSNALEIIATQYNTSVLALNTSPSTRGKILSVDLSGNNGNLIFQPSRATPVMLKVTSDITDQPFAAFYQMTIAGTPIDVGSTANYWSGAGSCLDFTGVPVYEAFDEKPDRSATDSDPILDWQNTYAIDWQEAQQKGDVYLRTITYTNPEADTVMQAVYPQGRITLTTPDQEGDNVALNGISSMQYNSFSGGSSGKITSVSQVFDLVKQGGICVLSNGSSASFYWNPQTIYTQTGENGNIHELTQNLTAGSTCIGRT
jgi:hypothetical protein